MLKTIFTIDDHKYFRDKWMAEGIPICNVERALLLMPSSIKGTYVINTSYNKQTKQRKIRKRIFYNEKGKVRKICNLGAYEKSAIIGQCERYVLDDAMTSLPVGVVNVQVKEI